LVEFFGPGSHGTTFGGNPLAMAAACKTMEIIFEESFLDEVGKKSEFLISLLQEKLKANTAVKEVRGLGLIIGIELELPVANILAELREAGLIVLNAGEKVIRLLPSLNITTDELKEAVTIIENKLNIYSNIAI